MIYQKIWFDGTTVRLRFLEQLDGAKDAHEYECAETPTGAFKGSLAAFGPFVVKLLGLPLEWSDCDVRSLALKREEKTSARGLQVTVMRKIADAKNRPVTITTPYLSEPPAEYNGDGVGYLDDVTLKLIEEAERQAEAYRTGERGEQIKMDLDSSNTDAFNERSAAAEVASTRKPKGRGKLRGKASTAPEPLSDLTDDAVRQLLASVDRDVPIEAIRAFSIEDRNAAIRWAELRQKEIVGTMEDVFMPAEPEALLRVATPPLKADEWTSPEPPPQVSEEAARELAVLSGRAD